MKIALSGIYNDYFLFKKLFFTYFSNKFLSNNNPLLDKVE